MLLGLRYLFTTAAFVGGITLCSGFAQAQTIVPAPDATGTQMTAAGNTFHIDGGTQAGANLFHSFQQFGLEAGQIANFLAHPQLANILARVTGGTVSQIDGTLQVTGGNPNLYLMNPAGIVFGPNASLNVTGDFFATTADRIGFEGGGWFESVGASDYASLIGTPNQFAFLSEQPGAIANRGQLAVGPGRNLGLIAGTVVNRGTLTAGSNVTLAAIPGERTVRLSQPGMLLSLELPAAAVEAGIQPVDLPALLTGSGWPAAKSGDVATAGLIWGETVNAAAAGRVRPNDPDLIRTGDGRFSTPTVTHFASTLDAPVAFTFLDVTVPDYQSLLYGGRAGTTTVAIAPDQSGIAAIDEQLAAIAATGATVDELHIVSEGGAGNFWLGRDFVSTETVGQYREQLQGWRGALGAGADVLLYSCFTALGSVGEALLNAIATETGADVAASTDLTGNGNLGGNWQLETTIGAIEAELAFTAPTQDQYRETLATFTVTTGEASADLASFAGSLRWAVFQANTMVGSDEIRFAPNVSLVNLQNGALGISDSNGNLTLNGQGRNIKIQGNHTASLFQILDMVGTGITATFDSLTLTGGNSASNGGAIHNPDNASIVTVRNSQIVGNRAHLAGGGIFSTGVLNVENSTISGNQAGHGGGIANDGIANVMHSTLSQNQASNNGGGIYNAVFSTANLSNVTLSGNQASGHGGGAFSGGSSILNLRNATIANNTVTGGNGGGLHAAGAFGVNLESSIVASNLDLGGQAPDVSGGALNGSARNLVGSLNGKTSGSLGTGSDLLVADPGLAPLGNYGGRTQTQALLPTSAALDAGFNASGQATDQRGLARLNGSAVDIGAYESAGFNLETLAGDRQATTANTAFAQRLQVQVTEAGFGQPLPNVPVTFNVPANGASAIAPNFTLLTNATGIAGLALQANDAPGTYIVQAIGGSGMQVDFELTNLGVNFDFNGVLPPLRSGFMGEFAARDTLDEDKTVPDTVVEALDRQASDAFAEYLGLKGDRAVSLAEIRRQLRYGEAQTGQRSAVIYAFFRPARTHLNRTPETWQFSDGDRQHAAAKPTAQATDILELTLVPSSGDAIQVQVPAAQRDRVGTVIRRLRRNLINLERDRRDYLPPAQQLHTWLIEPLEGDLERLQIDNLVFIFDTGLRSLPVAALHNGEQFLVERYSLGLLPSLGLAELDHRPLHNATVLAMGADTFTDGQPLPAVPVEIDAIANQLWSGEAFLNEAFTLANLKTARAEHPFRIVHLATHGEFNAGQPQNSYIQFWDAKLTLDRLSELGLSDPQVDLLVLSACRTALGDPEAELGFAGLAVAAGVKSALGSLWYVSDEGTLALMTHFYEQLQQAPLTASALQAAQVAMLRGEVHLEAGEMRLPNSQWPLPPALAALGDLDFSHPYYWSSFTLIGSPW